MDLPPDLFSFLTQGLQLSYDPELCDAGEIKLLALSKLKTELFPTDVDNGLPDNSADPHFQEMGCYLVPAVSLLASCDNFDPVGLLLWIPNEHCYGTWDSSHNLLEVFTSDVTWSDIAKDPVRYINSFWSEERAGGLSPLIPWSKYEYDPTQPCEPKSI